MLVVKDAMVIIHLAKTTLLDTSCTLFKRVIIPNAVYDEVLGGESQHLQDVKQLKTAIVKKQISVVNVKDNILIRRVNEFNIFRGEAEAVALYWQEKADLLATDDDNVRKKKNALGISTIGTPAIMIKLFRDKKIDKNTYIAAIRKLKDIGWFSNTIFDKMLLEAEHG